MGIAYCRTMGEYADVPWCVRARGFALIAGAVVYGAASYVLRIPNFFSRASVFAPGKKNIPFADFPMNTSSRILVSGSL